MKEEMSRNDVCKEKHQFIVMFFPTDSGEDLLWLHVDQTFQIEVFNLDNPQMEWESNIKKATVFSTVYQAKKFACIAQELWHFSFFKIIEMNAWELEQIEEFTY